MIAMMGKLFFSPCRLAFRNPNDLLRLVKFFRKKSDTNYLICDFTVSVLIRSLKQTRNPIWISNFESGKLLCYYQWRLMSDFSILAKMCFAIVVNYHRNCQTGRNDRPPINQREICITSRYLFQSTLTLLLSDASRCVRLTSRVINYTNFTVIVHHQRLSIK